MESDELAELLNDQKLEPIRPKSEEPQEEFNLNESLTRILSNMDIDTANEPQNNLQQVGNNIPKSK